MKLNIFDTSVTLACIIFLTRFRITIASFRCCEKGLLPSLASCLQCQLRRAISDLYAIARRLTLTAIRSGETSSYRRSSRPNNDDCRRHRMADVSSCRPTPPLPFLRPSFSHRQNNSAVGGCGGDIHCHRRRRRLPPLSLRKNQWHYYHLDSTLFHH